MDVMCNICVAGFAAGRTCGYFIPTRTLHGHNCGAKFCWWRSWFPYLEHPRDAKMSASHVSHPFFALHPLFLIGHACPEDRKDERNLNVGLGICVIFSMRCR